MKFERAPYYLRQSIDEIILDARKKITVNYTHHGRWYGVHSLQKIPTGCQITDQNEYREYFYEPHKFEIPNHRVIECANQRSAHQNAIIALKKWESELRSFLVRPGRKNEYDTGEILISQELVQV